MSAAEQLAALDATDPSPSFDESAARAGVAFRLPEVGERCGLPDLDVARYWPAPPPDLVEPRP